MKKDIKKQKKNIISIILTLVIAFNIAIVPIYSEGLEENTIGITEIQDEETSVQNDAQLSELTDIDLNSYAERIVATRNVEIRVTNFDVPIQGAFVSLDGETFETDDEGIVIFDNIAVSDNPYEVEVAAENFGRIKCDIKIHGEVFTDASSDEIPNYSVNLYFKKEESAQAYSIEDDKEWVKKSDMPCKLVTTYRQSLEVRFMLSRKQHPMQCIYITQ